MLSPSAEAFALNDEDLDDYFNAPDLQLQANHLPAQLPSFQRRAELTRQAGDLTGMGSSDWVWAGYIAYLV